MVNDFCDELIYEQITIDVRMSRTNLIRSMTTMTLIIFIIIIIIIILMMSQYTGDSTMIQSVS